MIRRLSVPPPPPHNDIGCEEIKTDPFMIQSDKSYFFKLFLAIDIGSSRKGKLTKGMIYFMDIFD